MNHKVRAVSLTKLDISVLQSRSDRYILSYIVYQVFIALTKVFFGVPTRNHAGIYQPQWSDHWSWGYGRFWPVIWSYMKLYETIYIYMVGGWPTSTPLKNMSSSMGRILPYWTRKIKHVWNHQPGNHIFMCLKLGIPQTPKCVCHTFWKSW